MNSLSLNSNIAPINPDATLAEALEYYRSRVSIEKKGYLQESFRVKQLARSFMASTKPREITSVDLARYRDERLLTVNPKSQKPLSNATVRLELALLSNFFDIARKEWGLCDSNPVNNIRKPKIPAGRDRRLSPREERQILRYLHKHKNDQLYTIIILALETAMRQGEIISLQWDNINLKSRIAHLPVTKNGSKRDIPLSARARDVLVRMGVKPTGSVFTYSSSGIKSSWRYMIKNLGIEDLKFHDLRHEATSRLFELGTLDLMEIAAITGHKSLSMLKRYTHLKAARLVKKLEGNKHRGKQYLFDHLIPYPAELRQYENHVAIRLLDFEETTPITSFDLNSAIQLAQDLLMRVILTSLKESKPIPHPDQYLEDIEEKSVIMIDPFTSSFDSDPESSIAT